MWQEETVRIQGTVWDISNRPAYNRARISQWNLFEWSQSGAEDGTDTLRCWATMPMSWKWQSADNELVARERLGFYWNHRRCMIAGYLEYSVKLPVTIEDKSTKFIIWWWWLLAKRTLKKLKPFDSGTLVEFCFQLQIVHLVDKVNV